jgi:prepilin-type N-terminal cleavage/methylation domain-containing protein
MKKKGTSIKRNKRAFTLVELLAVIAIVAILAVVTIPMVMKYIQSSAQKGFAQSVYHAMDAIREDLAADDFKQFPDEGLAASELAGLDRNPFIGGMFFIRDGLLYASNVTDGKYCASGRKDQLNVVLGDCALLDTTPPIIDALVVGKRTSNSIQLIVTAHDDESDIIRYEYSKDHGNTFVKSNSNTYTFQNLTHDTAFPMVVKVFNGAGMSTTKTLTVRTLKIDPPTYTSEPDLASWSKKKDVTIHYPTSRQDNFIYEYRKDHGKWQDVPVGSKKMVTFTANGVLEARVRDGYNTVAATTLTITTIDTDAPAVPTYQIRYDHDQGTIRPNLRDWTNRTLWWGNFSATDTGGSGIDHYEYSNNCTGSKTGNLEDSYLQDKTMAKTYCIRALDRAGNASAWTSPIYFNIDKDAPTVPTAIVRYDSSGGTVRGNTSDWTNRTLWWGNFSATDTGGSGFDRYEYSENCTGNKSGDLEANYTFVNNTKKVYCIRSTDRAGNASAWSDKYYFNVDKTGPIIRFDGLIITDGTSRITSNSCDGKTFTSNATCDIYISAWRDATSYKLQFDTYTTAIDDGSGVKKEQHTWVHNGDKGTCLRPNWSDDPGGLCWTAHNFPTWIEQKRRYIDNTDNIGVEVTMRYHISYHY